MIVECTKMNGIGVVKLSGQLTTVVVESFREQLVVWQTAEPEVKNFVFDLSAVDFMDSAGLGSLIACLKRIRERGGEMKIACLQKRPQSVFEITRAYKVFEVFETKEEAMKSAEQ